MCISFLYIFRTTIFPSSEEKTVSVRRLLFVTQSGWLSGMQGAIKLGMKLQKLQFHSTLHSRQSSTHSDKYQVLHRYSYFSWWWAHSPPKHLQKRNKHTKKNCASSWLYLQDCTRMKGQQNINSLIVDSYSSEEENKSDTAYMVAN
jgi:hypothetical protein